VRSASVVGGRPRPRAEARGAGRQGFGAAGDDCGIASFFAPFLFEQTGQLLGHVHWPPLSQAQWSLPHAWHFMIAPPPRT
jgi:hypothetical protein